MKLKIILLIILVALSSCQSGDKTNSSDSTTEPVVIIEPEPPEEPELMTVKFAIKSGNDLYFSDSEQIYIWKSGNILKSGPMQFTIDNEIITLDQYGNTVSISYTHEVPASIKTIDSDVYYCIEYTAQESLEMGATPRIHSEFYKNGDIISSPWFENEFECKNILSVGTEIFSVNQTGGYHTIQGDYKDVFYADEIIMHSINMENKTIGFNRNIEHYNSNTALNPRQWIFYAEVYYAENGYTWTETGGLIEASTALHGWNHSPYPLEIQNPNGQAPILLKAGISNNNLYWIECNSGFLFEYNPNTDKLTEKYRLYIGDGMRSTGTDMKSNLKPLLIDNILYYSEGDSINSLDIDTGSINIFYANPGEVVRYD